MLEQFIRYTYPKYHDFLKCEVYASEVYAKLFVSVCIKAFCEMKMDPGVSFSLFMNILVHIYQIPRYQ